jgi:hypothetical protein
MAPPLATLYITPDDVTVRTTIVHSLLMESPAAAVAAKRKTRLLAALSEHIAWGWLAAAVAWLLVWGVVAVYGYLWALLLLLGDALTGASDAWWVFGMVMLAALVMRSSK